jgi:CPA1 family monovalent cation:H+ antiporter
MSGVDSTGGVFLILLLFVVVFALLAQKLRTPYPIVLVIAGLVLSVTPGTPHIRLNPTLVFAVMLPPLLYSAAWLTSWNEFRRNLVSIVSAACGLVGFTILGIAVTAHWLFPGFDWRLGLVLGAVVAPTDAIAATAIASQVGLPRRIVDLLEGESLVNDATGLLALEFSIAMVLGGTMPSIGTGLLRFVYLVAAGLGTGLIVATATAWIERWIDDGPIEIAISLMVPYTAYLGAEAIDASGVLAVVACGLMLSRRSTELFSPAVRLQVYAAWNAVGFILNGVVFVLIGLQLPEVVHSLAGVTLPWLIAQGAICSALVVALRLAWAFPGARLSYFIRRHFLHQSENRPSARELLVFGWSGMRGVVSLAAAMALPLVLPDGAPFPQRNLIVFLTFSVVVSTLVVQGLSLAPLIRALGLAEGSGPKPEVREAHRIVLQAALVHLEERRGSDRAEYAAVYDDLVQHYRQRLDALSETSDRTPATQHYRKYRALSRELLGVQRQALLGLRHEGRINDQTLRNLERDLDLQEARARPPAPR